MLKDFRGAYIDYLTGLLRHEDIDVNIVRETLGSLGFNGETIEDILGDALHMCSTSVSSCSSDLDEALSGRASPVSSEEVTNCSSSGGDVSAAVPRQLDFSWKAVDEHIGMHPHDVPRSSSESLQDVCNDSIRVDHHRMSYRPHEMWCEPRELSPSSGRSWNNLSLAHERRNCYRKHLQALERLVGLCWTIAGGGSDGEIIPLEIRSLLCRQRLELFLCGEHNVKKKLSCELSQVVESHSGQFVVVGNSSKRRKVTRDGHCFQRCEIHSHCNRQQKGLLSGKTTRYTDTRRQCEFCANIENRFLYIRRGERFVKSQTTPIALASACSVKMHDRVVNTVGRGRINKSSVATTLSQREDRVKKALAYRKGWSAVGFLGRRDNS